MTRLLRSPFPLLIAALLCSGCTVNYYRNVDQRHVKPVSTADAPEIAASDCQLDWEGAAPRGWTVGTVRSMVNAIPATCKPPAIVVHSGAGSVDWETGDTGEVDGLVVRSAVMEHRRQGEAVARRIHLFTGATASTCDETGSCRPRVVIVRQGPRGPRGRRGRAGPIGKTGPTGPEALVGPVVPQAAPAKDGAAGDPGTPGRDGSDGAASVIVKALPPAVIGGGLVYTLMYLNLLSVPGAAAPVRGIRKPPPLDPAEDDGQVGIAGLVAADDPRVRVSSATFEGDPA